MADSYFSLKPLEQKEILQTAAAQLGRQAAVLEKDIWVCWVLQTLFSIPDAHPMAFKGGTSLSKIYDIIDRFSEDVDITLDYREFDDVLTDDAPVIDGMKRLREIFPNACDLTYERNERAPEFEASGSGPAPVAKPSDVVDDFLQTVRAEAIDDVEQAIIADVLHDLQQGEDAA
jgi:hypothetical protein